MVIDSNTIIYSARPEHAFLREFFAANKVCASEVSKIEVLGYHKLQPNERVWFEQFFDEFEIVPISSEVINCAVELRQTRKMSIGDAVIAATAFERQGTGFAQRSRLQMDQRTRAN